MTEWTETTLGEVLTLQRGFDLPARIRKPGPYPIVSSAGVTGFHDEFKAAPPGVVIGRYGSLGTVHWIDQPYWPLNTSLWVKDFKGNDERFVSYLLQTIDADGSAASAVPGVNRNHLHQQSVVVPRPAAQRRIAGVLSAFDALIEINERRIALLEDLARSLYREWFVHFRFPGCDSTTFHQTDLGSLPSGWSAVPLGATLEFCGSGSTPRRSVPTNWEGGATPWYTTGELRDGPLIESKESVAASSGARLFKPGTILMAIYGSPTVGRLGWVERACSANQAALGLVAKDREVFQDWLWHQLVDLRGHFNAVSQGAAQQNISKSTVVQTLVAAPPRTIAGQFADIVCPLREQRHTAVVQNFRLAATRDLLLPRLVTGQIDLDDIDLGDLLPAEAT